MGGLFAIELGTIRKYSLKGLAQNRIHRGSALNLSWIYIVPSNIHGDNKFESFNWVIYFRCFGHVFGAVGEIDASRLQVGPGEMHVDWGTSLEYIVQLSFHKLLGYHRDQVLEGLLGHTTFIKQVESALGIGLGVASCGGGIHFFIILLVRLVFHILNVIIIHSKQSRY